jgi:hypothetical protein
VRIADAIEVHSQTEVGKVYIIKIIIIITDLMMRVGPELKVIAMIASIALLATTLTISHLNAKMMRQF